jgi:hypothetical protein
MGYMEGSFMALQKLGVIMWLKIGTTRRLSAEVSRISAKSAK